jgi:hypothetical protein
MVASRWPVTVSWFINEEREDCFLWIEKWWEIIFVEIVHDLQTFGHTISY